MTKKDLKQVFEEHKKLVEPVIEELLLDSVDPRHHEIVKHQLKAGGKRLRPVIAMLSCQMMDGDTNDILYPAAGLEIMHNYTLIVDDIIDHSEFRRNRPTTWKKYGVSMADCVGIYYIATVFLKTGQKYKELPEIFARTIKKLTNGEMLDILFEKSGRDDEPYVVENRFQVVSRDDYIEMIGGKTAIFYSTCCEVGGVCAHASGKDIENLKSFGMNLGLAFQIQDDILDTFGDQEKIGKEVGKDIKERKISNIVNLLALEQLEGKDKEEFESIFDKEVINDKDVKKAIELINKTEAKGDARKMASEYIDKAKESLAKLPKNEWNKTLSDLADYIVARDK